MKIQSIVFAGFFGVLAFAPLTASAADAKLQTIAAVNQNKAALAGKKISAQGAVVKVNNGIMGRNFVHVQDGATDTGSNKLIVTSKQTANVGDKVTISGVVVLDRDFGSGYSYPLLIEDASIVPRK